MSAHTGIRKYRLVRLPELCGENLTVYSLVVHNETTTRFHQFLKKWMASHRSEIIDLVTRLKGMAKSTGAREHFFKLNEGIPGDGVCALYDRPEAKLRLYAIRYGTGLIILGGGGQKNVRTLQEDPELKASNYLLREVSVQIRKKMEEGELRFTGEGDDFDGNLEIDEP